MKKRIVALFLLAALALTLFAACGKKNITPEEAQAIALKAAGLTAKQASDIHTHVTSYGDNPCYNIHITAGGQEYSFFIDGTTGEILNADG